MPGSMSIQPFDGANCYKYPAFRLEARARLTLGDLHGNPMKLLYFLVVYSVLDISEEDYEELVVKFESILSNQNKLSNFVRLKEGNLNFDAEAESINIATQANILYQSIQIFLSYTQQVATVCENPPMVRLLGDDLADRIGNDLAMLLVQNYLAEKMVLKVVISNHTIEYLVAYENYINGNGFKRLGVINSRNPDWFASLTGLEQMLPHVQGLPDELTQVTQAYHQRLLYFDMDVYPKMAGFYSHGVVSMIQAVEEGARNFGLPAPKLNSMTSIMQTIHAVNNAFQQRVVAAGELKSFYQQHRASFKMLIWQRWRDVARSAVVSLWPEEIDGRLMLYIHGHDCEETGVERILSLDDELGKCFPQDIDAGESFETMVVSSDTPPRLGKRLRVIFKGEDESHGAKRFREGSENSDENSEKGGNQTP